MTSQLLSMLAAAEGHSAPPLIDIDGTLYLQGAIFLLLLFVLSRLVFRPYLALKREQAENTAGARDQADRDDADAAERLARYEARVMEAKKAAAFSRGEQRAAGTERAQAVLADARKRAEAKLEQARRRIAASAPAAQLALRTRADELARLVASRILGRNV